MVHQKKSINTQSNLKKKRLVLPKDEIDVLKIMVKSTLGKRDSKLALSETSFGDVRINFIRHELFRNGIRVPTNTRELKLLKYFILHEGEVLSRDQLLRDVWGFDNNPTTRSVDNYVLRLRKKIETDIDSPKHLLTVHGAGYKFTR